MRQENMKAKDCFCFLFCYKKKYGLYQNVTKQVQKHCVNSPQMSGIQEIFSNLIKKQYKVEIFKKQYKIEILLKKQYKIASNVKDKIITLFRIKSDSCFQQM